MGEWKLVVEGEGRDIEVLVREFVGRVQAAGHRLSEARVEYQACVDLLKPQSPGPGALGVTGGPGTTPAELNPTVPVGQRYEHGGVIVEPPAHPATEADIAGVLAAAAAAAQDADEDDGVLGSGQGATRTRRVTRPDILMED